MKKVYVYHNGEMVEKRQEPPSDAPLVAGDIPDFVSSVDGRIIHGRAGLRRHNKELGVTNTSDFTEVWAKHQKNREALFSGRQDHDPKRKEAIIRAYHKIQGRSW